MAAVTEALDVVASRLSHVTRLILRGPYALSGATDELTHVRLSVWIWDLLGRLPADILCLFLQGILDGVFRRAPTLEALESMTKSAFLTD